MGEVGGTSSCVNANYKIHEGDVDGLAFSPKNVIAHMIIFLFQL